MAASTKPRLARRAAVCVAVAAFDTGALDTGAWGATMVRFDHLLAPLAFTARISTSIMCRDTLPSTRSTCLSGTLVGVHIRTCWKQHTHTTHTHTKHTHSAHTLIVVARHTTTTWWIRPFARRFSALTQIGRLARFTHTHTR